MQGSSKEKMARGKSCYSPVLLGILILAGLWATSLYGYLLFHSVAELFSIVVACAVFAFAWNTRRFAANSYLLFIGIAYLFVGAVDLTHMLAYEGMGVFPGQDANLPTQLWVASRYVESVSLLVAPLLVGRKLKTGFVFAGYIMVSAVLLGSIFWWEVFPVCFSEAVGLTTFKIASEYIISFLLLASAVALFAKRDKFERNVLGLLIAAAVVTICSELAFTLYSDPYGLSNLIGHYFKIVSFYLIYRAIIETGLSKPFALLFRDLERSKDALERAKESLEVQVGARTAELAQSNVALRAEIVERNEAELRLEQYQQRLKALASRLTIVEERDRRRIAAELHSDVGQSLALARMQLASAQKSTSASSLAAMLDDVSRTLLETIQGTRRVIHDLSPPSMNEIGLAAALSEWLEENVEKRVGLEVEFVDECGKVPLDDDVRAIMFRSVRELLTNVLKHAQADKVRVCLRREGQYLKVIVKDDGVGFAPGEPWNAMESKHGFGLFSIQERMVDLGGSLDIVSEPGKGCRVILTALLSEQ